LSLIKAQKFEYGKANPLLFRVLLGLLFILESLSWAFRRQILHYGRTDFNCDHVFGEKTSFWRRVYAMVATSKPLECLA